MAVVLFSVATLFGYIYSVDEDEERRKSAVAARRDQQGPAGAEGEALHHPPLHRHAPLLARLILFSSSSSGFLEFSLLFWLVKRFFGSLFLARRNGGENLTHIT